MNPFDLPFRFRIGDVDRWIDLRARDHVRVYPTGEDAGLGRWLTRRQVDLLRIATAIHVADGRVRRRPAANGHRRPILDLEVLDAAFWSVPSTMDRLKICVDFLSGGDSWAFRFRQSRAPWQDRMFDHARDREHRPIVSLYSGGLDSAAGLAARVAEQPGRPFIPVTVRYQMQRGKVIDGHFAMIREHFAPLADLRPIQVAAFVRNRRIKAELGVKLGEVTHRCRPLLFMAVAGVVANLYGAGEVEVYESGVGSVNLPLVAGPADHRTTRSSHPRFLALMSDLVGHVNEGDVRYVLPFEDRTKAEMVARLRELGLEELARRSVSCIIHPIRRSGGRQCGHCPACVFRRQAMQVAGIPEGPDAYDVDLFSPAGAGRDLAPQHLIPIRAFLQQVGRLAELETGHLPGCYRTYLIATGAAAGDGELGPYIEVYRRYRREWGGLVDDARDRGIRWAMPARPHELSRGATR